MKIFDSSKLFEEVTNGTFLYIDKDLDLTSFDVIRKVRRIFKVRKVGHAGTLDPKATGLMILATGSKTKEISKYMELEKEYIGTLQLGAETQSGDTETEIIKTSEINNITEKNIQDTSKLFIGEIEQIPPMHSAIKHGGTPLYKFARMGKEVEREPRKVFISKFDILNISLPFVYFNVVCSKGTYIRSLVVDFGKKLGVGAFLKELTRVRIGNITLEDSYKISDLESITSSLK